MSPASQQRAGVVLVGETLVDEFSDGAVAGGAPFNVARSLAALGGPQDCLLLSRLNPGDPAGQLILQSLRRFALSDAGLQMDATLPSGRVTVSEQAGAGHDFTIHRPAAWDALALGPALAQLEAMQPRFFYFGSLAQRAEPARASICILAERAGALGAVRYLDLNLRADSSSPELAAESLQRADWLKVNDGELSQLWAWFGEPGDALLDPLGSPTSLALAVQRLMARFALQLLILTRGAAGYVLFDGQGRVLAQGRGQVLPQLLDTVGAGDAFSAMFLAAVQAGQGLEISAQLANRYAAAMCGVRGPMPGEAEFFTPWRAALASSNEDCA